MDATDRWMTRLEEGRKRRDDQIARARADFNNLVVGASKAGLTTVDIREATGLSQVTIREILRYARKGEED